MMIYIAITVFLFGLIVGSFLNVVIVRMYTGRTFGGRSVCMSCQRVLCWYDLVPLVSFLVLRGRCRQCDARISARYFFVELITGVAFLSIWLVHGIQLYSVLYAIMAVLLIVLSVYDWRHKIIPNFFPYALIFLGILALILPQSIQQAYPLIMKSSLLEHLVSGVLIPLPFFCIWLISRGRWFGLGDVKLMMVIGLFFGFLVGIEVVITAFWMATAYVVLHFLYNKMLCVIESWSLVRKKQKRILSREIPFGPFLSLSFFISLLGIHMLQIVFRL